MEYPENTFDNITSVALFKNEDKEKENQPDWRLTGKIGDKWITLGSFWKKEGEKGVFLSGVMAEPREYEYEGVKKTTKGFHIAINNKSGDIKPEVKVKEDDGVINADDIPF
jgi:hypothetical protein